MNSHVVDDEYNGHHDLLYRSQVRAELEAALCPDLEEYYYEANGAAATTTTAAPAAGAAGATAMDAHADRFCINWNVVNGLLQKLSIAPTSNLARCSAECDPMGRLFLGNLLSRNPPTTTLEAALRVFPESLSHNPVAFFTACHYATPQVVASMARHMISQPNHDDNSRTDECPFPWIFSEHITIEGAKAIIEVYPQGVLEPSSFLESLCPLDYALMSEEMVKTRNFDETWWNKFKLMLVAAESCDPTNFAGHSGLSPVQTLTKRVLSNPDVLNDAKRAEHFLWLLHQLRWTDHWVFAKQCARGKYPLHHVLDHKCTSHQSGLVAARELVKILLEAHPESARHLVDGKLALHMALENGWPCHDLLLSVYPEALNARDQSTELYPFQCAAQEKLSPLSLDVTFELLKANPAHARSIGSGGTQVGA